MILHNQGESIEAEECEIITRKWVISGNVKFKNIGRCFTYTCSRNCSSKILKELNPKQAKINSNSYLNQGSELKAEGIYVITKEIKRPKFKKIKHSGTHNAQWTILKKFTYSEIKYPLENVIHSLIKRNELKS